MNCKGPAQTLLHSKSDTAAAEELASLLLAPAGSKQSGAVAQRLPLQDCIVAIEVDPTLEEAFLLQRSSARMVRSSILGDFRPVL
jgi:hypothetical protein